jgi:hypothetical protein
VRGDVTLISFIFIFTTRNFLNMPSKTSQPVSLCLDGWAANHEIFNGFSIEQIPIKYSRGKVEAGQSRKQSVELLIKNF